ncbi:hypothetical protein ACU686_23820 [Yinghuangia aomiensis]
MLYRLSGLRGLTARCRTRLSGPGGRAAVWGGLLVLVWLFAFAAHALHADPLSALAVFVGTASLLRAGSALLDRFVLAAGLLGGATITAALLFSVWPWHLQPAPIAGCAMTALLAVAFATGRRPKLPRKVLWSDAVILASGAASAITLAWPVARVGFKQSLPYLTAVGQGDRLRHFSLFDAIQQVGGYGFFHSDQAREIVLPGMEANYPSGTHMPVRPRRRVRPLQRRPEHVHRRLPPLLLVGGHRLRRSSSCASPGPAGGSPDRRCPTAAARSSARASARTWPPAS